jgi:hypothetical protein
MHMIFLVNNDEGFLKNYTLHSLLIVILGFKFIIINICHPYFSIHLSLVLMHLYLYLSPQFHCNTHF